MPIQVLLIGGLGSQLCTDTKIWGTLPYRTALVASLEPDSEEYPFSRRTDHVSGSRHLDFVTTFTVWGPDMRDS